MDVVKGSINLSNKYHILCNFWKYTSYILFLELLLHVFPFLGVVFACFLLPPISTRRILPHFLGLVFACFSPFLKSLILLEITCYTMRVLYIM